MQPAFVIWNDGCSAYQPNACFLFLNQNLATSKLFSERNLSIGTNDLDCWGRRDSLHGDSFVYCQISAARTYCIHCINLSRWWWMAAPLAEFFSAAVEGGMRTLKMDGMEKV